MTPLLHATQPPSPSSPPGYRAWHAAVAAVWISVVIAGLLAVARHSYTPGRASTSTTDWALGDRLPLDREKPTLVMALHAQCPCSRASVAELGELLEQHGDEIRSIVLIDNPIRSAPPADAALWRQVAALPGVQLVDDVDGQLGSRLDAETSGQAYLYDPSGALRFSGGITASRGHVGANDGIASIDAILRNKRISSSPSTPVFGCALR